MKGNKTYILSVALRVVLPLVCVVMSIPLAAQTEQTVARDTLAEARVASAAPAKAAQSVPLRSVSREEIERLGLRDAAEAVRGFAGVELRDYGGLGGLKTVSIRGLGAQHTAVACDGAVVSNVQSGQVDIGSFSLENVETISVAIGQGDDIFRSARLMAAAGALEIKSLRPDFRSGSAAAKASLSAASFSTCAPALYYAHKLTDKWCFSAETDWLQSEGDYPYTVRNGSTVDNLRRKNGDVRRIRGGVKAYGTIEDGEITISTNYLHSKRGLPGSVILYNDIANERLWGTTANLTGTIRKRIGEWEIKGSAGYNYDWNRYLQESEQYASGKMENNYAQQEYSASAALMWQPTAELRFSAVEDLFRTTLDSDIPECVFPRRTSSITALNGQYESKKLKLTGSLIGTYITETVQTGTPAPDRKNLAPAISLTYRFRNNLRARASYKEVFRTPTFNDLYYNRVGNTSLKPERANQFNAGITWNVAIGNLEYLSITTDCYYNRVKDKIVAIPTFFIWKMMNMGLVDILGSDVTAESKYRINNSQMLSASLHFTYQKAVNRSDPGAKNYGHQIPYTPRYSGGWNISWENPWVNLSYIATAVGKRYALPQNIEANKVDAYIEHTLSASREFHPGKYTIKVQADCVNLTGKTYEVIKYYPMPGRSFRITTKFAL